MIKQERHARICEYLDKHQFASINTLMEQIDASKSTVRRDLMDANKLEREENVAKVKAEIAEVFLEKYPDNAKDVAYITQKLVKKIVRRTISVDKIRPDGRQLDEVRPVSCGVREKCGSL